MKKKILWASLGLAVLGALVWVYRYGYLEIVPDSGSDTYYTLTSLSDDSAQSFTSSAGVKKMVRRGQYQLLAQRGETSYIAHVGAGGFLSTTTLSPKLVPERSRKFIGDNPVGCAYYTGRVLASGECEDLYSQLNLHVPAKPQQATYTQKLSGEYDGVVGGVAHTKLGMLALLRSTSGEGHTLYKVNEDFNLASPVALNDLDKGKLYSLQPYKEGFLAYDRSLSHLLYYSSLNSRPTKINTQQPKDKKLQAYLLKTRGEAIIVGYSDHPEDIAQASGDEEHLPVKPPKKTKVAVMVLSGNEAREYAFGKRLKALETCGSNKLCILDTEGRFEAYDITNKKPRFSYGINGVEQFSNVGNRLVAAHRGGMLSLDIDRQEGYIQYSFGSYQFCGMYIGAAGYSLCMINGADRSVGLHIDPAASNNDSIDKKVAQLGDLAEIKTVSAYDNFLFVSPNLGEPEYRAELRSFGYNPSLVQTVNGAINQAIDKIGIDRSRYTIYNPFN